MADNKAKLAAARKLLKERQQLRDKTNGNGINGSRSPTNSSASGVSPINSFHNETPAHQFFDSISAPVENSSDSSFPLHQYFNPIPAEKTDSNSTSRSESIKSFHPDQTRDPKTNDVAALEMEIQRMRRANEELQNSLVASDDKIKVQHQTISMLVAEKTDLQRELGLVQDEHKTSSNKCMELSVKMKALKSEIARLQNEARDSNETRQQHNSILKKLEHSLHAANQSAESYKKNADDAYDEIKSLNKTIEELTRANESLSQDLKELHLKFSMAEIKIAQLGGTPQTTDVEEGLNRSALLEKENEKLSAELNEMKRELNDANIQFKGYIETLQSHLEQANNQNELVLAEKNELMNHKEGLLKQLGELERQISRERMTGPSLSQTNADLSSQLSESEKRANSLQEELSTVKAELIRVSGDLELKQNKLQDAEEQLERLEVPDVKLLQAAMESDRVAARRAIEQNTALKTQLAEMSSEMSSSIVKLNNEKLDLTERLQHAEHLVKDLRAQLQQFNHHRTVEKVDAVAQSRPIFLTDDTTQTDVDDIYTGSLEHVTADSVQMLERKLKKTMDTVALLSDEKQRLEHLVLQLQGETETICEYVTLYQNQRGILQEKAREKEIQLKMLAEERESLKMKLTQINNLLPKVMTSNTAESGRSQSDATVQIKTLLTEIEESNLVNNRLENTPNFHPCLLCSGKLITV